MLGVEEMPPDVVAGRSMPCSATFGLMLSRSACSFLRPPSLRSRCLRRWQLRAWSWIGHDFEERCAPAPEANTALQRELLPIASLVTPNIPEAETITGMSIKSRSDMEKAAAVIVALGAKAVLVKGGHSTGNADDLFFDGHDCHWLPGARINARNTHGTGCTLSSAIAAFTARGMTLLNACRQAKSYVRGAMAAGLEVGHGCGPLHHFFQWYGETATTSSTEPVSKAAGRARAGITPTKIKDKAAKLEKSFPRCCDPFGHHWCIICEHGHRQ